MLGARFRFTISAEDLNKEIERVLERKETSVTKNPGLKYEINEQYIQAVTPFVPYRHKYEGKHLIDAFQTSDGRITWSATNKGYDYADIQYRPEEHGVSYVNYTTPGTGSHWTDKVHPITGKEQWARFVKNIEPLIQEAYNNG